VPTGKSSEMLRKRGREALDEPGDSRGKERYRVLQWAGQDDQGTRNAQSTTRERWEGSRTGVAQKKGVDRERENHSPLKGEKPARQRVLGVQKLPRKQPVVLDRGNQGAENMMAAHQKGNRRQAKPGFVTEKRRSLAGHKDTQRLESIGARR